MEPNEINPISVLSRMHIDEPGTYNLVLYHLTKDNIEDLYFKLNHNYPNVNFQGYGKYFKIILYFNGDKFGVPSYTQDEVGIGDYILADLNRHIRPIPVWGTRFFPCLDALLSIFKNHKLELKKNEHSIKFEVINHTDKLTEIFCKLKNKNPDYIMIYDRIAIPPSEHKRIYFIEIGDYVVNSPEGTFIVNKDRWDTLNSICDGVTQFCISRIIEM